MRQSDDHPTISLPEVEPADAPDQAALGQWFPQAHDESPDPTNGVGSPRPVSAGPGSAASGGEPVRDPGWSDEESESPGDDPSDDGWGFASDLPAEPDEEREAELQRDEELLAAAPSTVLPDELDAALSAPPPSARSLRLTKVLGVALVVALGFAGGVALGQRTGAAGTSGVPGGAGFTRGNGQFPGGFPGAAGGPQSGGTGSGAAAGDAAAGTGAGGSSGATGQTTTTGTVKLVDGSVIYLTDADGNLTRVVVDDDADVVRTREADLDDIETGDSVTVTGTTSADGVAASSVAVTR